MAGIHLPTGRTDQGLTESWELGESGRWGEDREGRALAPGQWAALLLHLELYLVPVTPSQASLGITPSRPACVTERSLSSLSTPWRPPPCTLLAAAPTTTSRSPTKTSSPV